jgi:hypothetical protein
MEKADGPLRIPERICIGFFIVSGKHMTLECNGAERERTQK